MPEEEGRKQIVVHVNSWKILTLILLALTLWNTYLSYNNQAAINQINGRNITSTTVSTTTTIATRLQLSPGDTPSRGPASAKVTIIEFSDYQCPYCASAEPFIQQVLSTYPNDVKLYYRNFPLTQLHPNAVNASMAAECANEQGKFWEMHDKLFANQQSLDVPSLKQYAKDLGLDTVKFSSCLDSGKYQVQISKDAQDGLTAGVGGTPSFYIDGLPVQSGGEFAQVISSELGK